MLQILAEHCQVQDLLIEGSGNVNAAAFQAGIIDGVYLTLCPKGAGGREIPTAVESHGFVLADLVHLELLKYKVIESEVFLHYRL